MNEIPESLLSAYDPASSESTAFDVWEKSGYQTPERLIQDGKLPEDAPTFSMVLPPPNVTGILHTGHALTISIEDSFVRYKRLRGFRTTWIPGTDHAAIATQIKVEKQLDKEGVKKQDIGRDAFVERVHAFALESQTTIINQEKRIGASLDWSREAFTLDEARQVAVREAFVRMYNDGLIFRKNRIVNWDPKGRTTVSDEEVEHTPDRATLYTFRYGPDFPIAVATTRLETKVGDTAVAVHPDDERYQEHIGTTHAVNFCGVDLTIHIIADESIDPEFGTGAVGITPAHSMTDWEIAERHELPIKQVIDERARMMVGPDWLKDTKTREARERIAQWLRDNSLLESEEEVEQNVSTAQRGGGVIEPLPKLQWFIDVDKEFTIPHSSISGIESGQTVTLKQLMKAAVENGDITFMPDRFTKNYFNWVDNLHPWCISRQIWYGHRIPVWYRNDEVHVSTHEPEGDDWEQDPDTLDTWFSSGLWTFSTLGWPDDSQDLKLYHPTSLLETGHDILPFWVSRMILMSTYHLGEIPFKRVYFHGMVRDEQGQKMSKSLGNAIDPVETMDEYGTDALRMALIIGNAPGTDLSFSHDKVKAQKRFANKIWNAARFVLTYIEPENVETDQKLTDRHTQHLEEFNAFVRGTTKEMDEYRLHLAAERMYDYFWHTFADVVIEDVKDALQNDNGEESRSAQWLVYHILHTSLVVLHPIMPFITETIWSLLPVKPNTDPLFIQQWPEV